MDLDNPPVPPSSLPGGEGGELGSMTIAPTALALAQDLARHASWTQRRGGGEEERGESAPPSAQHLFGVFHALGSIRSTIKMKNKMQTAGKTVFW